MVTTVVTRDPTPQTRAAGHQAGHQLVPGFLTVNTQTGPDTSPGHSLVHHPQSTITDRDIN